ncbi:MAG: outer membrane protein assembly factor BamA [Thermodesulfobacteriota bacterium]
MSMTRVAARLAGAGLALALFLCLAGQALAQDADKAAGIKLVVLPFEVNADPDLAYLQDSLPDLVADKLAAAGFAVVERDKLDALLREQKVDFLDLARAKDLALLSGAKFAVYGSFNQIGETLSLDVRLVDAFGLKPAKPLFVVQEGLINVLPAVEDLAEKIKNELLKKETVAQVEVAGVQVLDKDVVLMRLKTQKGDIYDPKVLNQELKTIYDLGYFDDVQVKVDELPDGVRLTFVVKEKPRIQAISILGAEEKDEDDVLEVMSSRAGAVLNPKVLAEDLGKIKELYRKDGYYKAEVSYKLEGADAAQARLDIVINEGPKLYIKKINIEGAKEIDPDDLRDELALAERGFLSWVTQSGVLKEELLLRDAAAIEAYYGNRGFIEVKVGQPDVQFEDDGIVVTFKVEEGRRFKIGSITFSGDILEDTEKLLAVTTLDEVKADKQYIDRSVLREDSQALAEYYSNYGYAYAEANYYLNVDADSLTADVDYSIRKKQKVYVRRVVIEGNDKTRDNVIRRRLRLMDGDLFSGKMLKRSNQLLAGSGYYEAAEVTPTATGNEGEVDLKVKIKEKATGQISAGVGYSSLARIYFAGSVEENNLFGKGYLLGLSGQWSGRSTQYTLAFTNPNYNDTPLLVGGELYTRREDLDYYNKETMGGRARFGYPMGEYSYLSWGYRLDFYDIYDVDSDAAQDIKDIEGNNISSAATISASRDTTDRKFNPSEGAVHSLSMEYAGGLLMGDDEFIKYIGDTSQYYPLWWDHVFHWHLRLGYVMPNMGGDEVPVFERFYLGGINTVRGYASGYISPYDESTGDRIGGNKMGFTNFEYIFPLFKEAGLMGVTFFDAGETWEDGDSMDFDLKKSVGGGLRWYSPIGPLRFEYGYALDEVRNQGGKGKFEFSVGQFF